MHTDQQKPAPLGDRPGAPAEVRMAELILQMNDEVSRAKMETFLHFARDPSRLAVAIESLRDCGIRFVLIYPPGRS